MTKVIFYLPLDIIFGFTKKRKAMFLMSQETTGLYFLALMLIVMLGVGVWGLSKLFSKKK